METELINRLRVGRQENTAGQQQPDPGNGQIQAAVTLYYPLTQSFQLNRLQAQLSFAGGVTHEELMEHGRKLRGHLPPFGQLPAESLHQGPRTHLILHPLLQKGFGRLPQIKLGVEAPTQALDVEQGLLQQHQLWLDLHIEPSRRLKQMQQQTAKGDVLDRFSENRLADTADGGLKFLRPGLRRYPAGPYMGIRHRPIIAVEECQKVLGEIALVPVAEGPHDTEIDGPILAFRAYEDIPGMHVGVKKAITECLGEKDLDAIVR